MHRGGGKKGGDVGSGNEAPARRRKPPATLLESVHIHAMERADYKPPKSTAGLFHHGHHGVTDDIIKRMFSEPSCLPPMHPTLCPASSRGESGYPALSAPIDRPSDGPN